MVEGRSTHSATLSGQGSRRGASFMLTPGGKPNERHKASGVCSWTQINLSPPGAELRELIFIRVGGGYKTVLPAKQLSLSSVVLDQRLLKMECSCRQQRLAGTS